MAKRGERLPQSGQRSTAKECNTKGRFIQVALFERVPCNARQTVCKYVHIGEKSYLIVFYRARREVSEETVATEMSERAGVIERAVDVAADKILVLDLDDSEECKSLSSLLILVYCTHALSLQTTAFQRRCCTERQRSPPPESCACRY